MVNKNTNMCCWTSNKNHQKSADLESCWGKTGHLKKKCYQKWRHLTHPDIKALFCFVQWDFQPDTRQILPSADPQRIMDLSSRSVCFSKAKTTCFHPFFERPVAWKCQSDHPVIIVSNTATTFATLLCKFFRFWHVTCARHVAKGWLMVVKGCVIEPPLKPNVMPARTDTWHKITH